MGHIQNDLSEQAIIYAIEASLIDLIKLRSIWSQAEVADTPEIPYCFTGVPYPHFNVVLRAKLPQGLVDITIHSAIDSCKKNKVPMGWIISPSTHPYTLSDDLVRHGYVLVAENSGMAIDLHNVHAPAHIPDGLIIRRIETDVEIKTWCQVVYQQSGGMLDFVTSSFAEQYTSIGSGTKDSSVLYYLGFIDNTPVGASLLMLSGGVAGIYNVATIPEAQRKGFVSAMTVTALHDAIVPGYRIGMLHTTEMSYQVYKRLGFQEQCKLGLYA